MDDQDPLVEASGNPYEDSFNAKFEAEERKAVKIGMILQSYGHTQRDETKEQRDGWNCI